VDDVAVHEGRLLHWHVALKHDSIVIAAISLLARIRRPAACGLRSAADP
jgi:hypothetical protein